MGSRVVPAGYVGVVAGVLGALSAVVLLLWPPQVSEELLSYPLTADGFYVAQAWFFVHHLGSWQSSSDWPGPARRGPGGSAAWAAGSRSPGWLPSP